MELSEAPAAAPPLEHPAARHAPRGRVGLLAMDAAATFVGIGVLGVMLLILRRRSSRAQGGS